MMPPPVPQATHQVGAWLTPGMDAATWLRLVAVVLSVACLSAMAVRWWEWLVAPLWVRMERVALALLVAVAGLGAAESVVREVPPGVRTPLTTVALAYLLVALLLGWRAHRRRRPRD